MTQIEFDILSAFPATCSRRQINICLEEMENREKYDFNELLPLVFDLSKRGLLSIHGSERNAFSYASLTGAGVSLLHSYRERQDELRQTVKRARQAHIQSWIATVIAALALLWNIAAFFISYVPL